jgi:mono/diheme cytochrome c family protein
MVCHSRAAGFVLGLNTAQMNRVSDRGTARINQLEALDQLGLFRQNHAAHWEVLKERGRHLGGLLTAALPRGALTPLAECCLKPLGKALEQQIEARRARIGRGMEKNPNVQSLPRDPDEYPRLVDPADRSASLEARARSYLHANCAGCHVEAGGGNSAINLHINTAREAMKLIGIAPLHDRFGLTDARLIAPGAPERSVLYERLKRRGKGQMPPLASTQVDEEATRLIGDWIRAMK